MFYSAETADLGKEPMGSTRRKLLKIAGTEIAAGVEGNVLYGGAAEAGAGPGAGDKLTTVIEKLGELKFALV